MELSQLRLGSRVKMKLLQPDIICDGRTRIEAYFRGKVIAIGSDFVTVKFKSHRLYTYVTFDSEGDSKDPLWEDLKIIS